jgi:hypothetical protein
MGDVRTATITEQPTMSTRPCDAPVAMTSATAHAMGTARPRYDHGGAAARLSDSKKPRSTTCPACAAAVAAMSPPTSATTENSVTALAPAHLRSASTRTYASTPPARSRSAQLPPLIMRRGGGRALVDTHRAVQGVLKQRGGGSSGLPPVFPHGGARHRKRNTHRRRARQRDAAVHRVVKHRLLARVGVVGHVARHGVVRSKVQVVGKNGGAQQRYA